MKNCRCSWNAFSKVFLVPQPEELPEEVDFELEELSAELARPFNEDESPATKTIVLGISKESPMRS